MQAFLIGSSDMIKFTKNDVVDYETYGEELNKTGYILFDREKLNEAYNYYIAHCQTLANRAIFEMELKSGGRFFALNKDSVFLYLTRVENCPEHYFFTKKSENFSLDSKRVLAKLVANGRAVEFLGHYMAHKSLTTKASKMKSMIDNCRDLAAKHRDDTDLYKLFFTATVQENLRFNYKQYDIISQIPKNLPDIIAVEDGYFLAWGDFAQSDFRIAYNLFMRSEENDKIMNAYEDKYEALARIVNKTLGTEFDLDTFKSERQIYKALTLATVYGMRASVVQKEDQFIKTFTEFLNNCPKYAEYYQRLQDYLQMESPIKVTSYFGYEQFINYYKEDEAGVLYKALNTPIQTGTSEIVINTVNSILKMAREAGYDEDQFSIYMTRHDEPIFRIREDAKDSVWILQEHSKVLVDNWSPLQMDYNFGYRYKVPNEELTKEIESIYKSSENKITKLQPSGIVENLYYPLKSFLTLRLHWICLEECKKTIVTFMDDKTGRAIFSIYETVNIEDLINNVRVKLKQASEQISETYGGMIVLNNFYEGQDYFGELPVKYKRIKDQSMTKVVQLCKGMVNMFCKKNGLEVPVDCPNALTAFPEQLTELVV